LLKISSKTAKGAKNYELFMKEGKKERRKEGKKKEGKKELCNLDFLVKV
jgi:hypothetical protein